MVTISFVIIVSSALWAGGGGSVGGVKPALLSVARCCPGKQELARETLLTLELSATEAANACVTVEAAGVWSPRIYAPARGGFIDRMPGHWRVVEGVLPQCERLRVLPEHAASYALLANNGSLLLRGAAAALPPDRYCADVAAALVCAEDVTWAPEPTKCCAGGRTFDGQSCVKDPVRGLIALNELRELANNSDVRAGWPVCPEGSRYAVAGALSNAKLDADGALSLKTAGGGVERLAAGAWCAEVVGTSSEHVSGGARVVACEAAARSLRPAPHSSRHALYGAGLAVGALFLAATLAAGFALPAAHHALHWRCQTHYVAALMLGDVLLAVTQLAADQIPPPLCRALAICMHFLFLSAFFWLNTMCFNIWWTFR